MRRFPIHLFAALLLASLLVIGCGESKPPTETTVLDNGPTVTYPTAGTVETTTIMGSGGPYEELTYTHEGKTIKINRFSITVDGKARRLDDPQDLIQIQPDGTVKVAG